MGRQLMDDSNLVLRRSVRPVRDAGWVDVATTSSTVWPKFLPDTITKCRSSHRQPGKPSVTETSSFVVVTNSDAALATPALRPESLERWRGAGHAVVGEQEPEAKDWLGENIEDGVGNDLDIETDQSTTVGETPDTTE